MGKVIDQVNILQKDRPLIFSDRSARIISLRYTLSGMYDLLLRKKPSSLQSYRKYKKYCTASI